MQLWWQQGWRCEMRRLHSVAPVHAYDSRQAITSLLHTHRFSSTNRVGSSSSPSEVESKLQERKSAEPGYHDENISRLCELLREVTPNDSTALFFNAHLPRRKEVWSEPTSTMPPTPNVFPQSSASAPTSAPQYNSATIMKASQKQEQQMKRNSSNKQQHRDPFRWYGSPPGVIRDVDYFTGCMAVPCNTFLRTQYYMINRPTAPLLRCPACAAQLLAADAQEQTETSQSCYLRMPTSSRLWMDPPTLDRHLSWAHPDQLYTPQELAAYNDQVLRELMYSCGLATASSCGVDANTEDPVYKWKVAPARIILAVDVANVEMGAAAALIDMLTSHELCRVFAQAPVAICATHELFVPFASKTLHTLYQLALLHPSSTLHTFVANTSLESGDLMMSAYLNELMLASPTREIPPVVLLTNDGQQRLVASEMHGSGQRTLSPVGVVGFASPGMVSNFAEDVRAALTGSFWKV